MDGSVFSWLLCFGSCELGLLLSSPVREGVVAYYVCVGGVRIPFLDKGVSFKEIVHAHVEFLDVSGGLVVFRDVLHVPKSSTINCVGNGDESKNEGLLHILL